jgi:hypothetical protein
MCDFYHLEHTLFYIVFFICDYENVFLIFSHYTYWDERSKSYQFQDLVRFTVMWKYRNEKVKFIMLH